MPTDPLKQMRQAAELDLDVGQDPPQEESRQPWEQRDGETGTAYAAFQKFLALGITRKVVILLKENKDLNEDTARGWSRKHEWWARAKAWDAMKQRQRTAATKAAIVRITEKEVDTLEKFTTFVNENMNRLLVLQEKNSKFFLMPSELAEINDIILKSRRLISGESTDHSEVDIGEARSKLDGILQRYSS